MPKVNKRVCPWCGVELGTRAMTTHIKKLHNATPKDFILKENGWVELPKCKNPTCNNRVSQRPYNQYLIYDFCSQKCSAKYKYHVSETSALSPKNRVKDSDGKDLMNRKSLIKRTLLGDNPFSRENAILDEYGRSLISVKAEHSRWKNGSNFFRTRDPNRMGTLYIIWSSKYHRIKIGSSHSITDRVNFWKSLIPIDEIKIYEGDEEYIRGKEQELQYKYKEYQSPLTELKVSGWTEWFSDSIKNEIYNELNFNDYRMED